MSVEHQEKAVLNQIKAEKIATDSLRSPLSVLEIDSNLLKSFLRYW